MSSFQLDNFYRFEKEKIKGKIRMTDSLNNLNNMYVYINCLIHIRNLDRKYTDFRFRHKNMIYVQKRMF